MEVYNPTPKELKTIIPASCHGDFSDQLLVSDIQIDSRNVTPGSLFVALKGQKDNGERYISSAVENGAVAVLVEDTLLSTVFNLEIPIVGVSDLKDKLGGIAACFYDYPSRNINVIGITGTNGKSSIASYCAQMSHQVGDVSGVIGTLGYGIVNDGYDATGMTTPDVVSCQRLLAELKSAGATTVAMEVSSHGIDQNRIDAIDFDVSVISNISRDHLDYHSNFDEYAAVKLFFLEASNSKAAVVNADDPTCQGAVNRIKKQKECITFSVDPSACDGIADVRAKIKHYTASGMEADIVTPWGNAEIYLPIVGAFNLSNLLAALSANCLLGMRFENAIASIALIRALDGRMEKVEIGSAQMPSVYIDYAHTPDALEHVLTALKQHTKNKLWVVFGCGGDRDVGKRAEMGRIASELADVTVITSDNPRSESPEKIIADIEAGFPSDVKYESIVDRTTAIEHAIRKATSDDVVLVAGKGHEDYQLIGAKKIFFSDQLVAKQALEARNNSEQVGA